MAERISFAKKEQIQPPSRPRARSGIRTRDPSVTSAVLWPTEIPGRSQRLSRDNPWGTERQIEGQPQVSDPASSAPPPC